ncbi:MAG: TatD family hydrolase [Bacteroidota bacterium]|nr:TatD family hydrolase [Bacteroidota bacterium]
MQQINFHTHQIKGDENIQILNVFAQDLPGFEPKSLFSAGLHPWHVGKVNPEECIRAIEQATHQKNMLAIGECGLDRSISTDFALQKLFFGKQIQLAEKHSKPLIIHCVRAYSDLLELKKETKSEVPWIIHGFGGNLETTLSLIRHGLYFSVGEFLLKNEARHPVFRNIPLERLFLETDDSEISIGEIYLSAAQILKMDTQLLNEAIFSNFRTIFGNGK